MDEIARLAEFRADAAPMSAPARFRGRRRLTEEFAGRPLLRRLRPQRGVPGRRRRVLVAAALTLALTTVVAGSQIAGPGASPSDARAASVLDLAADALAARFADAPVPRPDQFVYVDVLHVTGSPEDSFVHQEWTSVDGTRTSTFRSTGAREDSGPRQPYGADGTLLNASYRQLAQLPTDPDALLKVLYADPFVEQDLNYRGMTSAIGVWDLIRFLLESACPPAQQAALFRAAARLPGISYVDEATDALGRPGEAVSLFNPRLGRTELILDRRTHAFLGERVLNEGGSGSAGAVQLNSAVRTVAFVDEAYQLPS
ncbi:CU044_5270 family protein [Kitasatospora phosalacinea]|uniref:CU044_5270 family protein n=1 Tax=Kitasatospora phosalacinea TaxID=2065 RepID=UPI0035D81848